MFDSNNKSASLRLSVPRDTRVRIDGHGWDKINHAYAYGGRDDTENCRRAAGYQNQQLRNG